MRGELTGYDAGAETGAACLVAVMVARASGIWTAMWLDSPSPWSERV